MRFSNLYRCSFLLVLLTFSCDSDEDAIDDTNSGIKPPENETGITTINYYDSTIVFSFSEDYTIGQFANGDYWVHNNGENVTINSIYPPSEITAAGRVINGAMINPVDDIRQGYDSDSRDMEYDETLNIDPGFTGRDLTIPSGTSIIKAISTPGNEGRPIIQDAVVLTVLSSSPEEGSFRPPYSGNDKTVLATKEDLDFSVLGKHPKPTSLPDINEVVKSLDRVWLEHCTEWSQRDIHPLNNMPTYGRDLANVSASGLILLQLDFSNEEKEALLIRLVQYGIDIYGIAKNGGVWYNNGGHNLGRKMPLLLAAEVLGNADMSSYANAAEHMIFQDDQQHFYVSQAEVDLTNSSAWDPDPRAELEPYQSSDIGMPEWGIRHYDKPEGDNKHWSATYRDVNGPAQISHILAAQLMGVKDDWNWPPVFDYAERYYHIDGDKLEDYIFDLWAYHLGE